MLPFNKSFAFGVFLQWLLIVFLVFLVYWVGLSGDFVFDDAPNILSNTHLQLANLSWPELWRVAHSGGAGELGRPISMLSFALNLFFTGFDPYWFKLTNILIHAVTAISVYACAALLLRCMALAESNLRFDAFSERYLPLFVALIWALHPLNLTSVLYVVQRMTSLSALFVFLGVATYLWGRLLLLQGQLKGWFSMVVGVFLGTLLAVFSKENGVLLPLFLMVIEFALLKFRVSAVLRNSGRVLRSLCWAGLGLIGLLLVCFFAMRYEALLASYQIRTFTLSERLLTEARVLVFYVRMIFLPSLSKMGIYHDDFTISHGFFDPVSTMFAILSILGVAITSVVYRSRFPLFVFGIGWFLVGHSLESTIWPLELVHEHRNYIPMFGLIFFAVGSVLYLGQSLQKWRKALISFLVFCVCLFSFYTFIRADQWSSLFDHAAIEQFNHPQSERANYQLGRMYFRLYMDDPKVEYFDGAEKFLLLSSARNSATGGYFGIIQLYFLAKKELPPEYLSVLKYRLSNEPFAPVNVTFIRTLTDCQIKQYCKLPDDEFVDLIKRSMENKTTLPDYLGHLNSELGAYYVNKMGDGDNAKKHLKLAIQFTPSVDNWLNLADLYLLVNQPEKAVKMIEQAFLADTKKIDTKRILDKKKAIEVGLKIK